MTQKTGKPATLQVVKASAGSGKTFRLAVEYIKLLIENPYNYRHILAVTFTNKATAEMQQRIVEQLYGIANGLTDSESYVEAVLAEPLRDEKSGRVLRRTEPDDVAFVRRRADEALQMMVADWGRVRVETIDSFFYSIVMELARELDLSPSLQLELEQDMVLSEAVDALIDSLAADINKKLLETVLEVIGEQIENDKDWKIDRELRKFSKQLFKEDFRQAITKNSEQMTESDYLTASVERYQHAEKLLRQRLMNEVKAISDEFFDVCTRHGLDGDNSPVSYATTIFNFVRNLGSKNPEDVGKRIQDKLTDSAEWLKKGKSTPQRIEVIKDKLMPLLQRAVQWVGDTTPLRDTLNGISKHINELRLLGEVEWRMRQINTKTGRFLLADTSHFLNRIIDRSDIPFVYERMGGSQIRYIMIDEFQDTSTLQWLNFTPLLSNSLASGNRCLLVGDVKQSIYRWRNSDWGILNGMEENPEFRGQTDVQKLDTNWRSSETVVKFNNTFFPKASEKLQSLYKEKMNRESEELGKAYTDMHQQVSDKHKGEGYVEISLRKPEDGVNKDEYAPKEAERVANRVKELLQQGVQPSDIAILVRRKYHAQLICSTCNRLLPDLKMVSAEAYQLDASEAVRLLIGAMRVVGNPSDRVARVELAYRYQVTMLPKDTDAAVLNDIFTCSWQELNQRLPQPFVTQMNRLTMLPLYELAERLFDMFSLKRFDGEAAYLFTFFDKLTEWTDTTANTLTAFLTYWDETLHTKTIPNAESEGVQVMTIHKSKGLEFHTVIVPFCEWRLDGRNDNLLWCPPTEEPFTELPLVPLEYSDLGKSILTDAYADELLKNYVDNLNLLYVAFTRARQNLIVMSGKAGKDSLVSFLLTEAVGTEYTEGTLVPSQTRRQTQTENVLQRAPEPMMVTLTSNSAMPAFRQSNKSRQFVAQADNEADDPNTYLQQGQLFHYLLSQINSPDEAEQALRQMQQEGLFPSDEVRNEVERMVELAFQTEGAREWFDPHWEAMNECSILTTDKEGTMQECRPDRVITDGTRTIVIDYKTGKPSSDHAKQVCRYVDLLTQMGYTNVEGYLWYIRQQNIVKI
ncbi:MAG: UvrD-helicase domain-containing protein [Prevotellaceae bacterium]|nr:UvrD-helicase domain-containing protein [Prevotellaceae bacterium]